MVHGSVPSLIVHSNYENFYGEVSLTMFCGKEFFMLYYCFVSLLYCFISSFVVHLCFVAALLYGKID